MGLDEDMDVMARTIYGEARGEPFRGMTAVGWVIRNRRDDEKKRFGKTIKDVCLKPKQFSCWNPDDPNHDIIVNLNLQNARFVRPYGIAALVLTGDLRDPTFGSDHYHAIGIQPSWATEMEEMVIIGNHRFLRSREAA